MAPVIVPPDSDKKEPERDVVFTPKVVPVIFKVESSEISVAVEDDELEPLSRLTLLRLASLEFVTANGAIVGAEAVPFKSPASRILPLIEVVASGVFTVAI